MGTLSGVRVLEMAGIGPAPFCGMMLADHGADVVRVDRKHPPGRNAKYDVLLRGRRSIALDLKEPAEVETLLRLVEVADVLIEGFRPGVMERLGLAPKVCLERNPKLVYGRMTGWGQSGPLAKAAGHDINYIALSGALDAIGRKESGPVPPLNLVGDFGGGGMLLAFGVVSALFEAERSGRGQVIDAAMTDGSALLMAAIFGLRARGAWSGGRGANLLDGGAHFYDTYECADGKWIAIGSIEPQFYTLLLEKLALGGEDFDDHLTQPQRWPALKARIAERIRSRPRQEWCALLEGSDVCFAPVLGFDEAPDHPHNRDRGTFVQVDGVPQPAPAPRFDRTPAALGAPPPQPGQHDEEVLRDWGVGDRKTSAEESD